MNKTRALALALLTAAVLAIVPATTARASNSYLCESSGSYCVGSAGTAWGDPVVERNPNGREITWLADGGCYSVNGTCYPTGTLKFMAWAAIPAWLPPAAATQNWARATRPAACGTGTSRPGSSTPSSATAIRPGKPGTSR